MFTVLEITEADLGEFESKAPFKALDPHVMNTSLKLARLALSSELLAFRKENPGGPPSHPQ